MVGGLRFYERAEVKDALSYFRLLSNKSDNLAFERVINNPKRGMGKAFLQRLHKISNEKNISLFDSLILLVETISLTHSQLSQAKKLIQVIKSHTKMLEKLIIPRLQDPPQRGWIYRYASI